jgi:hypothetical protein
VHTKKQYENQLDKRIFDLTLQINKKSTEKHYKTTADEENHLPLSARIKNFFI